MTDDQWIKDVVQKAATPEEVLRLIVDNESLFGFDPYYRDLRAAMLEQARKVLQ